MRHPQLWLLRSGSTNSEVQTNCPGDLAKRVLDFHDHRFATWPQGRTKVLCLCWNGMNWASGPCADPGRWCVVMCSQLCRRSFVGCVFEESFRFVEVSLETKRLQTHWGRSVSKEKWTWQMLFSSSMNSWLNTVAQKPLERSQHQQLQSRVFP